MEHIQGTAKLRNIIKCGKKFREKVKKSTQLIFRMIPGNRKSDFIFFLIIKYVAAAASENMPQPPNFQFAIYRCHFRSFFEKNTKGFGQ